VSLLYYWRPDNYRRDRSFGFGYHLNQNSAVLQTLQPGQSVWAFTRRTRDGLYVLAAELVTRTVTHNPPNYRYGTFRVWGDLERTRYFDVDVGPSTEILICHLSVRTQGMHLGQSFQGAAAVRGLTLADHQLLTEFARDLPVLDRAIIYPEDEFEARLLLGETARHLVLREERAAYGRRLDYLFTTVDVHRARRNVEALQEMYRGCCQICTFNPQDEYSHFLCHGHHIEWLSRGGEDSMENMLLLCPNHHSAIHRDDAPFDYRFLTFSYSNGRIEALRLNQHLPLAV
jgi:5-methylcytosine-specific restriction enzyme A